MPLPVIAAGTGAAIGGIAGGILGAAGSIFSGKQSADYAEESYKHRYQWMVKDLRKAGLNPMLAVSQGPGSPPQPDFPNAGEAAATGAKAGSAVALARLEAQNIEAATDLARHQGNKAAAEGKAQEMTNLMMEANPLYQSAKSTLGEKGEVTGPSALATDRFQAELAQVKNAAEKLSAETQNVRLANDLQRGELTLQEIRIKYADQLAGIEAAYRTAMAKAAAAGVPAAEADAAFWSEAGGLGKAAAFIKSIMGK